MKLELKETSLRLDKRCREALRRLRTSMADGTFFFKKQAKLMRGVALYLEDANGKFLLMKRTEDAPRSPGKWCPPSGTMERGESPRETLVREMKEELGITIASSIFVCDEVSVSEEGATIYYDHSFIFWAPLRVPFSALKLGEGTAIRLFTATEIRKMNLAFNHNEVFRIVRAWRRRRSISRER